MERCADLLPGFFIAYSETTRRHSFTSTTSGQDAQSASIPRMFFSCRLEASARGRWHPSTTSTSQNLKTIPACIHPRSDATFLWRPSTTSIHTKKSPASSYSKDTGLPSVIYKLEMRLELTTPSLRVKCSTD